MLFLFILHDHVCATIFTFLIICIWCYLHSCPSSLLQKGKFIWWNVNTLMLKSHKLVEVSVDHTLITLLSFLSSPQICSGPLPFNNDFFFLYVSFMRFWTSFWFLTLVSLLPSSVPDHYRFLYIFINAWLLSTHWCRLIWFTTQQNPLHLLKQCRISSGAQFLEIWVS